MFLLGLSLEIAIFDNIGLILANYINPSLLWLSKPKCLLVKIVNFTMKQLIFDFDE